jgi:hypothetical protein
LFTVILGYRYKREPVIHYLIHLSRLPTAAKPEGRTFSPSPSPVRLPRLLPLLACRSVVLCSGRQFLTLG